MLQCHFVQICWGKPWNVTFLRTASLSEKRDSSYSTCQPSRPPGSLSSLHSVAVLRMIDLWLLLRWRWCCYYDKFSLSIFFVRNTENLPSLLTAQPNMWYQRCREQEAGKLPWSRCLQLLIWWDLYSSHKCDEGLFNWEATYCYAGAQQSSFLQKQLKRKRVGLGKEIKQAAVTHAHYPESASE